MLEEKDLVDGDVNGAAWRHQRGERRLSGIEEPFADIDLPMPLRPAQLWSPRAVPGEQADVCGFLEPPDSSEMWKIRQRGTVSLHSSRYSKPPSK